MSRARGVLLLGSILVAVLLGFVAWPYLQQAASGLQADAELERLIDVYGQDPGSAPLGGHSSCTGGIGSRTKR